MAGYSKCNCYCYELCKDALGFPIGSVHGHVSVITKNLKTGIICSAAVPVCGSAPAIAVLQGEGERFPHRSLCGYRWPAMRIYWPFCEKKDAKTLSCFYSESVPEYRVDICEACNRYIKTVDLRKLSRERYIPLEQVATLHLGLKSQEMVLESGTSLYLEP